MWKFSIELLYMYIKAFIKFKSKILKGEKNRNFKNKKTLYISHTNS